MTHRPAESADPILLSLWGCNGQSAHDGFAEKVDNNDLNTPMLKIKINLSVALNTFVLVNSLICYIRKKTTHDKLLISFIYFI